ncbi:MAG: nuclear transport factor 2 family protein [Sandaracinaceae bacterium]
MTTANRSSDSHPTPAHPRFQAYKAIERALEPYIAAAKSGDGKLSRGAFLDHAHIVGSINGEYAALGADAFADAVSGGGASPNVEHHISWIDVSGPAAAARVDFVNWLGLRFTDFFVLYEESGTWKISGKVYDSHANN